MACRKGGGDLYHEGDIPFEGFGGREPKNQWGRGIHPQKPEFRADWFDIGGGCKMASGGDGGDLCHEGDILFERVGDREPENEWGRGIHPQNRNIERAGSTSVGGVKRLAERVEVTRGMEWMCSLRGWVLGNPRTSGAGGVDRPKNQISSEHARYWSGYEAACRTSGGNPRHGVDGGNAVVGGGEHENEGGGGVDPPITKY